MKPPRLFGYPIVLLATTALGLGAPKAFEGKVRFALTADHGTTFMNYFMKSGLTRLEVEASKGQTAIMLLDLAKHEMTMLMPGEKMYMVQALPNPAAPAAGAQGPAVQPDVQRTGQYETILGHKCEKIIVKTRDSVAEIWGAEGMGTFMNPGTGGPMSRGGPAPRSAWESELAGRGFFPLRVMVHDAGGKQTLKMEATEIDPSTPAESLFVPPPDYKKFEMPAMPGLGGLNPFQR